MYLLPLPPVRVFTPSAAIYLSAHVPPTEVPGASLTMKFGKHLKAVAVEGWEYLDYKQLKQLLKRLQSASVGSKEALEKQFMCSSPATMLRHGGQRLTACVSAQGGAHLRHKQGQHLLH